MKKISKEYIINYPILKIHLQDLEKLVEIFSQHCETCNIIADNYQLDSIKEIKNIKKDNIHNFKLIAHNPNVTIELSSSSAKLVLDNEDDLEQRGIAAKVDAILLRKKSIWNVLDSPIYFVSILLAMFVLMAIIVFTPFPETHIGIIFALLALIAIQYVSTKIYKLVNSEGHCNISSRNPDESPGFFKRNKDRIILIVFSSIISAVLTFIITYLVLRATK